jgi:hypothetical protein
MPSEMFSAVVRYKTFTATGISIFPFTKRPDNIAFLSKELQFILTLKLGLLLIGQQVLLEMLYGEQFALVVGLTNSI